MSILCVLGVPHTPKALRITAQGCRISGYPGGEGPDGSTLTGLRRAGLSPIRARHGAATRAQPLWGRVFWRFFTQGRRAARQPWAVVHNAFGVSTTMSTAEPIYFGR